LQPSLRQRKKAELFYTQYPRRFIKYILSNIGEVLTIAAAPILGLGSSSAHYKFFDEFALSIRLALVVEPPELDGRSVLRLVPARA